MESEDGASGSTGSFGDHETHELAGAASPAPPGPWPSSESMPTGSSSGSSSKVWLAAVIAFLIGGGIGFVVGNTQSSGNSPTSDADAADDPTSQDEAALARDAESAPITTEATTNAEPVTTTTKATTTTQAPYEPEPDDFIIEIVETSRKCFGTAGCSIEYEIDLTYVGDRMFDSSSRYQVIFEIKGGDDLEIGNFEVDGSGEVTYQPGRISTPPDPVLTATATRVSPA